MLFKCRSAYLFKRLLAFYLLGIFYLFALNKVKAQCHPTDFSALKALYNSTQGDHWKNRGLWNMVSENDTPLPDCDLSFLLGVSLNAQKRVTIVDLFNNNLTGALPSAIGDLSELTILSLNDNNLSGTLPSEIGRLSNLSSLSLSNNQFSGLLPDSLIRLKNLTVLFLDKNQFSGALPQKFTELTLLEWVFLENNQFSGNLPTGFSNLSNLTYLVMYQNKLQGKLPSDLDNLTELRWVLLQQNNFSGCYPSNLCALTVDSLNFTQNNRLPNFGDYKAIDNFCIDTSTQNGLPCNDENENTRNDVVLANCTCQGELIIAIDDEHQPAIYQIYPNPVMHTLYISNHRNSIKLLQIIDLHGKIMQQVDYSSASLIKVSHLPAGKYFLQILPYTKSSLIFPFIKL